MPKDSSGNLTISEAKLNELLNSTVFVGLDHDLLKLKIKGGDFNYFKVDQLKAMIKFLRSEANRYDISLQGKKANLVEKLKQAFFTSPPPSNTPPKPSSSSTKPRASFSSLSSQLNLQPVNAEEQRLLKVFNEDTTLKGRIDPHQRIERFLYIKVFNHSLASFSFDFDLSQEDYEKLNSQAYQINIHYFTHDMVPRNWNTDYPIFINASKIDPPPLNRKIAKGIKKEVLIVSTPFIIVGSKVHVGGNRIEIKTSPYQTLDGRLIVTFTQILKTEDLAQTIVSRSSGGHNLDIGDDDKDDNKINPNISTLGFTEKEKASLASLIKLIASDTKLSTNNNNHPSNDDGIEELEGCDEIVPLKDPISLCRIEMPAKGKFCVHKSCFDLHGYLSFGMSSKTYNCPRCDKPLPFSQLVVDPLMQKVLANVGQDVEKVLLKYDGSFTICDDAPKKRVSTTPAKPAIVADIIDDDDDESNSPPFLTSSTPITNTHPSSPYTNNSFNTENASFPPPFSISEFSRLFKESQNQVQSRSTPSPSPSQNRTSNSSTNSVISGLSVDDAIEID